MRIIDDFARGEGLFEGDKPDRFRLLRNGVDTGIMLEGGGIDQQFGVFDWSIVVSTDCDFDGDYRFFYLLDDKN